MKTSVAGISADQYEQAYSSFGGSFSTHPRTLSLLAQLTEIPVTYNGVFQNDELVGAVPVWGRQILSNMRLINRRNLAERIDLGQSETILPIKTGVKIPVPGRGLFIGQPTADNVTNAVLEERFTFAIAKGIHHGDLRLSKKSRGNRRREMEKIIDSDGTFIPVQDLSLTEFEAEYRRVYKLRRRGREPLEPACFRAQLEALHDMLCGTFLTIKGKPVAFNLLFRVESESHLYVNYVNSAVDPAFFDSGAGSAVVFSNLLTMEQQAAAKALPLRYCFGRMSADYKKQWCYASPAYIIAPSGKS